MSLIYGDVKTLIDKFKAEQPWTTVRAHIAPSEYAPTDAVYVMQVPDDFSGPRDDEYAVAMHPLTLERVREELPGMTDREIAAFFVHKAGR